MYFKIKKPKILVIGDMIIDKYYHGNASRLAQEAPTPVVKIEKIEKKLGGAANVINNLINLGSKVIACGVIGDDEYGKFLKSELRKKKVDVRCIIEDKSRITSVKSRILVGHHHMMRFDDEDDQNIRKQISQKIMNFIKKNVRNVNAIVVSDYDKGVISKPLLSFLNELSLTNNMPLIVDPKKRHHNLKFGKNSILKTNIQNSSVALLNENIRFKNAKEIIKNLSKLNDTSRIILTLGKEGMLCYNKGVFYNIKNSTRHVYDVTGAGDVALAVFTFCFLSGNNFINSCKMANAAAGINVGQIGTYAVNLKELRALKIR